MAKTTLIISTRDRPEYLKILLHTVFEQTRPFELVLISDNSSSAHFKELNKIILEPFLKKYEENLTLIPTPEDFASDRHTKYIQDNYVGETEFCVLFHDDDELLPNYHETVLNIFKSRANIVAVGCNALILKDQKRAWGTLMRHRQGIKIIKNRGDLLKPYMEIGPLASPPLCGYMFKSEILKIISFDRRIGGKYSDVVALSQTVTLGEIVWVFRPLIRYRFHSTQNSQAVSTLDFRNLLNYMVRKGKFKVESIYAESYRFKHMRLKLHSLLRPRKWRSARTVGSYMFCFIMRKLIWRSQSYQYIWNKIIFK